MLGTIDAQIILASMILGIGVGVFAGRKKGDTAGTDPAPAVPSRTKIPDPCGLPQSSTRSQDTIGTETSINQHP